MPTDNYTTRIAIPDEVALAVDWAASEGWNPGLGDADLYRSADPNGFLVGLLDDEPIATLSAIRYDDHFGFLGFYIVRPDQRGKGYGWRLWQAGMAYLEGCTVGLDGVVAQQENYRKSGFELAWNNVRYAGRGTRNAPTDADLVPLAALPFAALATYDRPFFPALRDGFLQGWIAQPGARALGLREAGKLVGYGVCRPCREGYKVGPLYADSAEGAALLFDALTAGLPDDAPYFLDLPEPNHAAVALAERRGMQRVFETARMYAGPAPELPVARIFGVTSFEIG